MHVTAPGGNAVAAAITGDGPDLLLVHGITEQRSSFDPVLPGLAETHRVIAVDLPGHGASDPAPSYDLRALAEDVHAVVEAVGHGTPAVVGHSLGGFVASVYAAAHPTTAVVNVDQPLALAAFKDALTPIEPLLRGEGFAAVIDQMFGTYAGPLPSAEAARLTALRRPDPDVVLGIWAPVFEQDVAELDAMVRDLLTGVDVPYLSLHGEEPGEDYRAWLASVIPQAEVEVWAGTAHYPHLAYPTRFVDRVRAHLAA